MTTKENASQDKSAEDQQVDEHHEQEHQWISSRWEAAPRETHCERRSCEHHRHRPECGENTQTSMHMHMPRRDQTCLGTKDHNPPSKQDHMQLGSRTQHVPARYAFSI